MPPLALGILNYIISNDLHDKEFCEQWINGFDKLAEHVKQFSLEWASEKTGVDVATIEKVAQMMGTIKPMSIVDGNGVGDQQNDGTAGLQAILAIAAVTATSTRARPPHPPSRPRPSTSSPIACRHPRRISRRATTPA